MIRLNVPDISEAEIEAAARALRSGQLTQGQETLKFEQSFAKLVGAKDGIAVSSATTGLELALRVLGIGSGDEVIIPDYSWPATGNAVVSVGATPIFADISLDTYCMDVSKVRDLVTARTRAIMPVHAFGHMADMESLSALSGELGIAVIEDAACAFGSSQEGRSAGLWGDFGVFSFHPRKIVTTGEGGMVLASDALNEQRARLARTHGAKREGLFAEFEDFGFNFRISEMQAAIGTVQLDRSRELLATRRRKATSLMKLLDGTPGAQLPSEKQGFIHSFQSFVILLDKSISRDDVVRRMAERGIETTLGTYSMSSQKSFDRFKGNDPAKNLANSHFAFQQALSIPLHTKLSDTDLEIINLELRGALASCGV